MRNTHAGEPLRVGLDMSPASIGISGIARYAEMLWDRLNARSDVIPRAFAAGRGRPMKHANILRVPIPLRVLQPLWRTGWPRAETLLGDVDVVHCLDVLPPPTRKPLVLTWHDLFDPRFESPSTRAARAVRLKQLDKAAIVFAYCQATADQLIEATGYPKDRIVITPPGFDYRDEEGGALPFNGPFVLAVGQISPRKGFDVLATAMSRLGPEAPPLVIAGPDGYKADETKDRIASALSADRVHLLGRFPDIASLYRRATVVCHPSLAEGFGLVCLEAMNAGAAIVAADIPSIREMGDGCVVLVPPGDPDALAAAIGSLLADPPERERIGVLAKQRASAYTWDRTAEQSVIGYRRAMKLG